MDYIGKDYQKKRIKKHQKFLLKFLHLRIGNYYPLRKWLGIDYKGKIDEITHLSIAYNTKYFKKGKKWFKQVTRTYQQPDLGYKLNLVLDKIPQLSFAIPALLQPAYGLAALAFFFLTQTTYQPSTKDTYIVETSATTNYGNSGTIATRAAADDDVNIVMHFDISDIPDNMIFSQGDIQLNCFTQNSGYVKVNRLLLTTWEELQATWNIYATGHNWATPGGDFTTTNSVEKLVNALGWNTWNASDLIQDCYDNQSKNVHLLINTTSGGQSNFRSNNYATAADRPKLTVTYTVSVAKDNSVFFGCNF